MGTNPSEETSRDAPSSHLLLLTQEAIGPLRPRSSFSCPIMNDLIVTDALTSPGHHHSGRRVTELDSLLGGLVLGHYSFGLGFQWPSHDLAHLDLFERDRQRFA